MGKYSATEDVTITKVEIAQDLLENAISFFLEKRFIGSIVLASAADGVFSGMLGSDAPAKDTWKQILELRRQTGLRVAGDRDEKQAMEEWNRVRNRLKHNNKDEVELTLNLFDESYDMIQRANAAGDKLGVSAANRQDYENWLIIHIHLSEDL